MRELKFMILPTGYCRSNIWRTGNLPRHQQVPLGEVSAAKGRRIHMNQEERRLYLIRALQREMPQYGKVRIPESGEGQWRLLRSLFNVRPPYPASPEFLDIQD